MSYNKSFSSSMSSSFSPQESKVQLPGGFHFDPEDGELIEGYLLPRCRGGRLPANIIPDIQDPYQHPNILKRPFEYAVDNASYFFTKFQPKSNRDRRIIRSINGGYWKTTSESKPVQHEKKTVGYKKTFTFYDRDANNVLKNTNWIMHEYTTPDGTPVLEKYVLCRLYKRRRSSRDSPNVRSDPPCLSSPDIASSRVQRQEEFYNDITSPYCNEAIPSAAQWDSLEMMGVDGRILSNEVKLVQFPTNEGHPQQRTLQQQEDMSLAYMPYPNDYMEQDGCQSWQHPVSEDYPNQLEYIFGADTNQEALQTFPVEFSNEDYRQSYAPWHEDGIQSEHHFMNNSQQQHAPQHDEDDERLALLLEGFKH